jgi:c-di-GMP-binding flagellar brake protein YcgR
MDEKQSLPQAGLEASSESQASGDIINLEDFRVTHPKVICDVLRQLMTRKDNITVDCNNSPHRIITRILAVNQAAGLFIYDGSTEHYLNRGLLDAEETFFSATQDGIRIQFVTGRPEKYDFDGEFSFCAALPQSLYRVQRREFFRAAAPLVESYCCNATLPDGRRVVWDIVDLSLDGLGLRTKDPTVGELELDTPLSKAVLNFGRRGSVEADLKVTNVRNIRGPSNPVYRIGCRFERFPKSKEQEFQRLITYLELARRGRSEGAVTKESGFY